MNRDFHIRNHMEMHNMNRSILQEHMAIHNHHAQLHSSMEIEMNLRQVQMLHLHAMNSHGMGGDGLHHHLRIHNQEVASHGHHQVHNNQGRNRNQQQQQQQPNNRNEQQQPQNRVPNEDEILYHNLIHTQNMDNMRILYDQHQHSHNRSHQHNQQQHQLQQQQQQQQQLYQQQYLGGNYLDDGDEENLNYEQLVRLQNVSRGVPQRELQKLIRKVFKQAEFEKDEQCGICLESFKDGDVLILLPCKHLYCEDEIKKWFEENNTCPTCRSTPF